MYRYVICFTSYVVMSCHVCVCMRTMNDERDSVASANGSRYTSILRYCWLKLQSLKLAKANDNLSPNPSLSIGHCNKQCVIDYTFSLHRAAVRGGYADDEALICLSLSPHTHRDCTATFIHMIALLIKHHTNSCVKTTNDLLVLHNLVFLLSSSVILIFVEFTSPSSMPSGSCDMSNVTVNNSLPSSPTLSSVMAMSVQCSLTPAGISTLYLPPMKSSPSVTTF